MKARTLYASLFVAAGLAVVACAAKKPPPKEPPHTETVSDAGSDAEADAEAPPKSLYERLGKQEGITAVVDSFTKKMAADSKLNKRMAAMKGPKLDKLKKDLVDQICVESGGADAGADCKYDGRFLREVLGPKGKLKDEEWNAMLFDLRTALEENKVGDNELQDMAAALSKFRADVVDDKSAKPPKK